MRSPATDRADITRRLVDSDERINQVDRWSAVQVGDETLGHVTAHAWSPRLERNVGIALVSRKVSPGDVVGVTLEGEQHVRGEMTTLPFI